MFTRIILLCLYVGSLQAMDSSVVPHDIVKTYNTAYMVQPLLQEPLMAPYEHEVRKSLQHALPEVLRLIVVDYLSQWKGVRLQDQVSFFFKEYYPCLAYASPDRILLGRSDGYIEERDVASDKTHRYFAAHGLDACLTNGVSSVVYDASSDRIISGGTNDGRIKVWRASKNKMIQRLTLDMINISSLLLLKNSVVISGSSESLHLPFWKLDSGQDGIMYQYKRHCRADNCGTTSLAAMNEEYFISTTKWEQAVVLWNAVKQSPVYYRLYSEPNVYAASINYYEYALAHGNDVLLCDRRQLNPHGCMEGHTGVVKRVASLGRDIISVAEDSTIKVWDVRATRICKETISLGSDKGILHLAVSPNARSFAVSFASSKRVKVFNLTRRVSY